MYLERFEFFCPKCKKKGEITDVLLNPKLMMIRGLCPFCNVKNTYKTVDISALQAEYEVLSEEVERGDQHTSAKSHPWNILRFKIRAA